MNKWIFKRGDLSSRGQFSSTFVLYYLGASEIWPDNLRLHLVELLSLERVSLVVLYYISASEIWPDKNDWH